MWLCDDHFLTRLYTPYGGSHPKDDMNKYFIAEEHVEGVLRVYNKWVLMGLAQD